MTPEQVTDMLTILSQINDKLDWLQTICIWLSSLVGVLIPFILVIMGLWWFFRQFIDRQY